MIIRKANLKDIPKVVAIHEERFSGFFLSSLGSAFLKVFYTAFLKNPAVLLVLEQEGIVKGFAAGSRDNRGFFKELLKNNVFQFGLAGIKILFTRPMALKRMAANSLKSEMSDLVFAELLSIATLKNSEGFGKILLGEFEREISSQNIDKLPISLTTDFDENEKVINFYKENGYQIHELFNSYQNRKMYRFIKNIELN